MNTTTLPLAAALLSSLSAAAAAEPATAEARGGALRVDAEVDPTAYVLDGHSLHLGVGRGPIRVDLGAFAMTMPAALHGQDGFTASFGGYGVKVQYFPFRDQAGAFVGVDAGVLRTLVARDGTDAASRDTQVSVGVHAGYRFDITEAIYATVWLGVGRTLGAEDVMLDGARWEAQRWTVFPAVHLGYRFR